MAADTPRPAPLPRPQQIEALTPDQVVAVVLRLAMEISVLRDRLRSHECLLEAHGLLTPQTVDEFVPAGEESAERQRARTTLIEKVIGDLTS